LGKKEKEGIIFVIITIFIAGALPIIVKYGSLIAGIFLVLLAVLKGNWRILFDKRYFFHLLLIGFFGITLSNICFFFGVTLTSGINSSILLVIEPLYAIFIGYMLLNEKITLKQMLFTSIIMLGTLVVVSRAKFSLNWGDLLVLLTPLCWQIAHFFSKRLMTEHKKITPMLIATARTLYGGTFLFILSSINGVNQYDKLRITNILLLLIFQGIVGFALHYSIWYEAIKRLNLSKATTLVSVYPTFSILLAWFILKELPTFYQLAGFALIMIGIFGLSGIRSEQREKLF